MADIPNLHDSSQPLSAERVFLVLRRRIGVILLCVLVAAGAAFGLSELQQKKYTASASLLFRNPGYAEDLFGTTVATQPTDPTREAATNEKLVGLKIVGRLAAQRLDGLSPEEVSEMVSVSAEGESEVVSVSATSSDPQQAQLVANTFARQFISFRAAADKSKLLQAKQLAEQTYSRLSPEEKSGVRGQALSRGAEKLGILASLQTGNAELVQPASSRPRPLRRSRCATPSSVRSSASCSGSRLAFLFERLNRRLRTPEEAGEVFDLPVLGDDPGEQGDRRRQRGVGGPESAVHGERGVPDAASLAALLQRRQRPSVRFLSPPTVSGVGKSTVAWNLARVAASSARWSSSRPTCAIPSLARSTGCARGPGWRRC